LIFGMEEFALAKKRSKRGKGRTKGRSKKGACSLEITHPNAAGIDLGAKEHWVAVPAGRWEEPVRSFSCLTPDLHQLADWLTECGVDTVAMESTGIYWIPLYEILEERGFEVFLVNTQQVKMVPGRKSDVLDCQWIQQLHSYGLLRGSFRPTAEIAELRAYLRHRETLGKGSSQQVLRIQKALVLMNLQLHNVITDITGKTGMQILRAIVDGERDPLKLAAFRDPRCKSNLLTIADSLQGNYQPEHLFALRQCLHLYDEYQQMIAECDQAIDQWMNTHVEAITDLPPLPPSSKKRQAKGPKVELRDPLYRLTGVDLSSIPGIAPYMAVALISEFGTDMSNWPTVGHFAAWLRLPPGTKISGGKILNSRKLPTSNRAATLLRLAAVAAGRTKTELGNHHRRQASRKDKSHAVAVTAHKIARIIYSMLKTRTPLYDDSVVGASAERKRELQVRNLHRQAKRLGFELVSQEAC